MNTNLNSYRQNVEFTQLLIRLNLILLELLVLYVHLVK